MKIIAKNTAQLAEGLSAVMQSEGVESKLYNIDENIELKKSLWFETKSNEVIHTTNTGFGAELIPGAVLSMDFIDLIPKVSPFIGALRGFRGRNLDKIAAVPAINEFGFHTIIDETTDQSWMAPTVNYTGKLPTGKVTLTQKKYQFTAFVSDEEVRFGIVDLIAQIQSKLAISAARTQESLILNGDVVTAATWNVNSDDGAPTAGTYYLGGDGVRKGAIANSDTVDMGTIAFDDYLAMLAKVWTHGSNPSDLIWLFNNATYVKSLGIDEFKDYAKNGKSSTINTGAITNVLGSDVFINRDFPLTEADWKVSVTAWNNTKGWVALIHRDAIVYGYNGDYQIEVERRAWKGWAIVGTYYMAVNHINKISTGWVAETGSRIVLWINATV